MPGNTYVQPVAGEPSWGSPHAHVETIVNAANPTGTGDTTVTVTNVPAGTLAIAGFAQVRSTGSTRILQIKDAAGNVWATIGNPATNVSGYGWFVVPIDSSKQFDYAVSNADVDLVSIFLRQYFI